MVRIFAEMQASQKEIRSTAACDQFPATLQIPAWQLFLEAFLIAALVSLAVFFLQWRYGFNWSDEGWLWYISQRTALGQIPIRDFFSYDPGRYYWSAFFLKILRGDGLFQQLIANAAFGILGLTTIYFVMSRIRVQRAWRVAILLMLAIMLGFPRHKIYEQALSLISIAGIAFVMVKPSALRRWLIYGVATGLAAFVGRNSGLYFAGAAVLLLLLLEFAREQFAVAPAFCALALGITIGYLPMIFMLCLVHGFAYSLYQSVLFSPHWQLKLPIPFPWHVHVRGLRFADALQVRAVSILCIAVPAAYLFTVWCWTKSTREKKSDNSTLRLACAASLAGLPFLHHAFSRADFFHIAQGIAPFAVVTGALSSRLWQIGRRQLSVVSFCAVFALILTAWLPYEPLIQYLRAKPGSMKRVAIGDRNFYVSATQAEVMNVVADAFRQCGPNDEGFLAAPYYPGLYALLHTKAPFWDLYYLWPRDDAFQLDQINILKQDTISLVLLNRQAAIDGLDALRIDRTYPKLVQYIVLNYQLANVKLPDGFELYYSPQGCKHPPSGERTSFF